MEIWHVTIASTDRMPLLGSEEARRAAVVRLAGLERREGALFNFVDDHFHSVEVGQRRHVARVAAATAYTLRPVVQVELAPAIIRPVDGRSHLQRLVPYVLNQTKHHRMDVHAALWSGSCFSDLVGARDVPGLESVISRLLPRLRIGDIHEAVGLPRGGVALLTDDELRVAGPVRIARAASFAASAAPDLRGRAWPVRDARRAATQIARAAGISHEDIAWALGITPRSARRIGAAAVRPRLVQATRLRLAIENALAGGVGHRAA